MENKNRHGGDLIHLGELSERPIHTILDFSVNVRPDGMPEFLQASLLRAINSCERYPSPCAEEVKRAAAKYFEIDKNHFVFGNGSNEILHAAIKVLAGNGYNTLCIFEPAFSEYSLAGEKAGMEIISVQMPFPHELNVQSEIPIKGWNSFDKSIQFKELNDFDIDTKEYDFSILDKKVQSIPPRSVIVIANPSNPSGMFIPLEVYKKWVQERKDCIWIFDEAFIDYVNDYANKSAINLLSENCMVLRSLTKFYAIASLRIGYLVCEIPFAEKLQKNLPAWNVNGIAIACATTIFAQGVQKTRILKDAEKTRVLNEERKLHLYSLLQTIEGICIYLSQGNFVLFSLANAPKDLWEKLLVEYGISMRNCANYKGLETGNYFRVAVRFPADHEKLVEAIKALCMQEVKPVSSSVSSDTCLHTCSNISSGACSSASSDTSSSVSFDTCTDIGTGTKKKKTPALMLLGTSSNAGKSILAAAFCRIFTQDGFRVKPFKSQNMSLNSGVTALGDEMGRAQIVQAQAARVDPDARMNPILLKPHSETGSQVILLGKSVGHFQVKDYYAKKMELWKHVCTAYDELAQTCDIMVLEGAGSPAEVNLKEADIVNIRMAQYAQASSLLVGDIDRGGIYASFLGTWMTFNSDEEKMLTGYLVNRFRGDASLLGPAHDYILEHTGKPVLGVIPYIQDLNIPEEDMAGSIWSKSDKKIPDNSANSPSLTSSISGAEKDRKLDIAIVQLAHISNHTDFEPLGNEPQCTIRLIRNVEDWGNPDIVILPGSKSVTADLEKLNASGLSEKIREHAQDKWLLGVCGGLQIMGCYIYDPLTVESKETVVKGLGLMNISSEFATEKTLTCVEGVESPLGITLAGYEIHHGISKIITEMDEIAKHDSNDVQEVKESFWHEGRACGYVADKKWATYVHGLFDDDAFRHAFLDFVREDIGLNPMKYRGEYDMEKAFDRLADFVRKNVDMDTIYKSMGLSKN